MTQKLWLSICFAFLPSIALAAPKWSSEKKPGLQYEVKCHTEDPTRCVLRMKAGEKAPFPGILQTFTQSAKVQVQADPVEIQKKVDAAVGTATKKAANDLALEKTYRKLDNEAWAKKAQLTDDSHKQQLELVTPSWYEKPAFVIPVTVVITLAAVGGTVAIACELGNCGGNN